MQQRSLGQEIPDRGEEIREHSGKGARGERERDEDRGHGRRNKMQET